MKEVTIYYAPERMVFKDPADALAVDKGPADHLVYYGDYVDVQTKLQTADAELVQLKAKYALADHTVEGLHDKLQVANELIAAIEKHCQPETLKCNTWHVYAADMFTQYKASRV